MLYRLEIENFYSIRHPQVVDLRVNEAVPHEDGRYDKLFVGSEDRGVRVVSFFGANASGKSTVLKALMFVAWFTRDSFQLQPNAGLLLEAFNSSDARSKPTRLAIEFSGQMDFAAEDDSDNALHGLWRYELTVAFVDNRFVVQSESLAQKPSGKGRWTRVFDREGHKVLAGKIFGLGKFSMVTDKVRDNASLISTLAQFDHPPSLKLRDAARTVRGNILVDRTDASDADVFRYYASNSDSVDALNREIKRIDLGIRGIQIQQTVSGPALFFEHEGLELLMPWALESHGTRNFIKYFPLIHMALADGGVVVIDELDIAIHPLVLPEILRWFQDSERNPHRAQLWISCHAASLLEDLLKEEVFFCEKNSSGETRVYGLQDIKDVRRTDNRYRKYLSGLYGSVPHLG